MTLSIQGPWGDSMAWIRLDGGFGRHPKILRLARSLGVDLLVARGIVVSLWTWTLEFAADGDLSSFEAEDIADGIGWSKDSDELIGALTEDKIRLLDRSEDGSLRVHDWMDYAGSSKAAEKKAEQRAKKKAAQVTRGPPLAQESLVLTAPDPIPSEGLEFEIKCAAGESFGVTLDMIQEWEHLFPAADVRLAIGKAAVWADANPRKRKTKARCKGWIGLQWIADEQNKPRPGGGNGARRSGTVADRLAQDAEDIRRDQGRSDDDVS